MKKLIISLLLITIFANNIYAQTYSGNTTISLSYEIKPTYSVKIPINLDISNNETSFNYYVSGDIYKDQTLKVLFDSSTTISNDVDICLVTINQNKTDYSQNELSNEYIKSTATITHDKLKPGVWYGQLKVVISLMGDAL